MRAWHAHRRYASALRAGSAKSGSFGGSCLSGPPIRCQFPNGIVLRAAILTARDKGVLLLLGRSQFGKIEEDLALTFLGGGLGKGFIDLRSRERAVNGNMQFLIC